MENTSRQVSLQQKMTCSHTAKHVDHIYLFLLILIQSQVLIYLFKIAKQPKIGLFHHQARTVPRHQGYTFLNHRQRYLQQYNPHTMVQLKSDLNISIQHYLHICIYHLCTLAFHVYILALIINGTYFKYVEEAPSLVLSSDGLITINLDVMDEQLAKASQTVSSNTYTGSLKGSSPAPRLRRTLWCAPEWIHRLENVLGQLQIESAALRKPLDGRRSSPQLRGSSWMILEQLHGHQDVL